MSETHTVLGSATANCRSKIFGATGSLCRESVVSRNRLRRRQDRLFMPHEPCNALTAHLDANGDEFSVHPRAAIPPLVAFLYLADVLGKCEVGLLPGRWLSLLPRIVSRRADFKNLRHPLDWPSLPIGIHEPVGHFRFFFTEKMATAFLIYR